MLSRIPVQVTATGGGGRQRKWRIEVVVNVLKTGTLITTLIFLRKLRKGPISQIVTLQQAVKACQEQTPQLIVCRLEVANKMKRFEYDYVRISQNFFPLPTIKIWVKEPYPESEEAFYANLPKLRHPCLQNGRKKFCEFHHPCPLMVDTFVMNYNHRESKFAS